MLSEQGLDETFLCDIMMCQQERRGTDSENEYDDLINILLLSDLRRRRDIYLLAAICLRSFQPVPFLSGFSLVWSVNTQKVHRSWRCTPLCTPHIT
jgi:hypothetical protein